MASSVKFIRRVQFQLWQQSKPITYKIAKHEEPQPHVFMEVLLLIEFSALSANVLEPLSALSEFFKNLCSNKLREDNLMKMHRTIPIILCKLEIIFPPSLEGLGLALSLSLRFCQHCQHRTVTCVTLDSKAPTPRCVGRRRRLAVRLHRVGTSLAVPNLFGLGCSEVLVWNSQSTRG